MSEFIVTNNSLVKEELGKSTEVEYYDVDFLGILEKIRDKVHNGYKLLTHPLSSSLKPNETPYKSVIMSKKTSKTVDFDSLSVIESSIETTRKFLKIKPTPDWNEKCKEDFRVIDLSVMEQAIDMKKYD